MFNIFKITKAGGQPDSPDLLGLLIIQTNQGLFLVDPESALETPRIISEVKLIDFGNLPLAKFRFLFKKIDWTLIVDSITSTEMSGRWINPKPEHEKKDKKHDYPDVEDHWVATGTGTGVPEDNEARAASATN